MRGKIILILLIMFGLIAARALYSHFATINAGKRGASSAPAVTVQKVSSVPVTYSFEAPARVSAKYRVEVTARISGYLTKSYFKEGDFVKAGQLLFEIEPLEYKLAVQQAKGNLDNARAQLNYYEKQLARYEELVQKDYVARSDYDNMLAQRDAYKAQVSLTEGAYNDALRNYGYTQVKAPVDGRIGIINVTVGNYVNAQAGYLTTINSEDPMYVTFPIDSKDYATLNEIDGSANVNRTVEYKFSTGMLYGEKGVQDFRDNKVDETTGTITLRATFKNPHGELIQGDYGRIIIFSNNKAPMPTVPVEAVMENQEGQYVYKLDEQNLPRLTYIKTTVQQEGKWIVSNGINSGDRVIVAGLQKVIAGQPVKIVDKIEAKAAVKEKKSLIDWIKSLFNKKDNKAE